MKIIITENQNYLLRRLQQLNDIAESEINIFEKLPDNPILNGYWCKQYNSADNFFKEVCESSVEKFIEHNWDFFKNKSYEDKVSDGFHFLNKLVEENYGHYIRILYHRKCQ